MTVMWEDKVLKCEKLDCHGRTPFIPILLALECNKPLNKKYIHTFSIIISFRHKYSQLNSFKTT